MAGEPQTPHSRLSPRLERDIQRINFTVSASYWKIATWRAGIRQHAEPGG